MWYSIDDKINGRRLKLFEDGLPAFQELWMLYFRKIIINLFQQFCMILYVLILDYFEEIMIKIFEELLHVFMNLDHMDMAQVVVLYEDGSRALIWFKSLLLMHMKQVIVFIKMNLSLMLQVIVFYGHGSRVCESCHCFYEDSSCRYGFCCCAYGHGSDVYDSSHCFCKYKLENNLYISLCVLNI